MITSGFGISTFARRASADRRGSGFAKPVMVVALALFASACGGSNPTSPSTTTAATSEIWSAVVAPGGASSRSFTANASGTITITMTSAGATVGLGVGVPRVTGGGCRVGVQVITGPGPNPQISTAADAGQYCVQVFDAGTLTDPVSFNIKIDHP